LINERIQARTNGSIQLTLFVNVFILIEQKIFSLHIHIVIAQCGGLQSAIICILPIIIDGTQNNQSTTSPCSTTRYTCRINYLILDASRIFIDNVTKLLYFRLYFLVMNCDI
jgi:hypothetical protein